MRLKINIERGKQNVYFTSDLHFGHKNIVRGTSVWTGQTRDFETVEEHDDFLIQQINLKVPKNDILFIIGDFSFKDNKSKDIESLINYRKKIACKNIYFVYGNHDEIIEKNTTLQSMFKGVSYYYNLTIKIVDPNKPSVKYNFDLSHYSKRTWNGLYQGTMMLYGHSHNMLEHHTDNRGRLLKTMDVGVDTRKDFSPYSLGEIIGLMDKCVIPDLDKRINGYKSPFKKILEKIKNFFVY